MFSIKCAAIAGRAELPSYTFRKVDSVYNEWLTQTPLKCLIVPVEL
jgi:hypothetical protein